MSQCKGSELLQSSGMGFIESVTRLIALLLDYRSVPAHDCHKGRRMGCMLNLLVRGERERHTKKEGEERGKG